MNNINHTNNNGNSFWDYVILYQKDSSNSDCGTPRMLAVGWREDAAFNSDVSKFFIDHYGGTSCDFDVSLQNISRDVDHTFTAVWTLGTGVRAVLDGATIATYTDINCNNGCRMYSEQAIVQNAGQDLPTWTGYQDNNNIKKCVSSCAPSTGFTNWGSNVTTDTVGSNPYKYCTVSHYTEYKGADGNTPVARFDSLGDFA